MFPPFSVYSEYELGWSLLEHCQSELLERVLEKVANEFPEGIECQRPDQIPNRISRRSRTAEVTRHYAMGEATIRAVDGVTLEIARGEFVALLGTSGSGKSTLFNFWRDSTAPPSGAILAHGINLADMSGDELAKYRSLTVGMVFQSFNLLPRMTLEENVELPLRLAEIDRADRPGRVQEALKRVGLAARLSHRPAELSGGEQQRASLARALVNRPTILLADEPTGNLDSRTGEEIMNFIQQFNQELGMTVIMVTHEPDLAERYAARQFHMKDGKLWQTEASNEIARPDGTCRTESARSDASQFAYDFRNRRGRGLTCGHALARHRITKIGHGPPAKAAGLFDQGLRNRPRPIGGSL